MVHGTFASLLPDHEAIYACPRVLGDQCQLVPADWTGGRVAVPSGQVPPVSAAESAAVGSSR